MYTFKCIERSKEKKDKRFFLKKNRNVVNLQYRVSFGYIAKWFSYLSI